MSLRPQILFGLSKAYSDWVEIITLKCNSNKNLICTDICDYNHIVILNPLVYIPLSISSIKKCIEILPKLELLGIKCFCPNSIKILETFNNKKNFENFMLEFFNINIPRPIDLCNPTYPYLLKHIYGAGGSSIFPVSTNQEHNFYMKNKEYYVKEYVAQEYIKSPNYIVCQYAVESGKVIYKEFYNSDLLNISNEPIVIMRKILKSFTRPKNLDDSNIIKIFEKLNYTGFACVDCTIKDGEWKLYEINPRVGGTMMNHTLDKFINKLIEFYC